VERKRLESIDLVRGIVMIIMALDHTRDYLGIPGANPVNLATTTVPLFFTRWITHICAPTFFLLAGAGARLALRRRSRPELSRFLFTRGLWLIFLELLLLRGLAWQFNFDFRLTMLVILWALGCSMIVLAALVYAPDWLIAAFGIGMIATHNLFDAVDPTSFGRLAPLWTILHAAPGFLVNHPNRQVFVSYALIPWMGVMAAGYVLGAIYAWDSSRRRAFLLRLGIALSVAFVILRVINRYGDPFHWRAQRSTALTIVAFLNTVKYPPSLLFLLMTLGPSLLLLGLFENGTPRPLRFTVVYGRVPLLYFALHAALIHLVALVLCYARYGQVHWMFESPSVTDYPITPPPGWGFSLPIIYLCWIFVVAALYPICRWFAALKQRRTDSWLSYL